MRFVSVPVPEEHVEAALEIVLRMIEEGRQTPWTEEHVLDLLGDLDPAARRLIELASDAKSSGGVLTMEQATESLGANRRVVKGLIQELNARAREVDHPRLLITQVDAEAMAGSKVREVESVAMPEGVAEIFTVVLRSSGLDT